MPTQAMRLEIIKPLDTDWKAFRSVLLDLRSQSARMANRAVQLYHEFEQFRKQYYAEHQKCPDEKEFFGCSYRNHVYRQLRAMYPEMAALNTSQLNQYVQARYRTDRQAINAYRQSIPSFKMGMPVMVSAANYALINVERRQLILKTTLLSGAAEPSRFRLLLDAGDKSKIAILERLLAGTYKQGDMKIVQSKRHPLKWFCIITYSFAEAAASDLDVNRVMGIDMGIVNAVYWAFNFSPRRGLIQGNEIIDFRKRVEGRRKDMLRTAGQTGHGRSRKMAATDKLQHKIDAFRNTLNHKYSRKIVDIALANRCGIIRMEDLTGISKADVFLKNWTYYDLQENIRYKAAAAGIKVELVRAAGTSQTCSQCGHRDSNNRISQAEFHCQSCGARLHADYNAALNICHSTEIVAGKGK